jgi:hypothetical protein
MCLTTQVSSFTQRAKPGAINPNTISQKPKWLSKDRFWNLVFAFGMSIGLSVAAILKNNPAINFNLSIIVFVLTILLVPFIVWCFSGVTFKAGKIFLNSENRELDFDKDTPIGFPFWIALAALLLSVPLAHKLIPNCSRNISDCLFINITCFAYIVSFMFKNCPVAIIYNLKYREFVAQNQTSSLSNDIMYDPIFKSSIFNVWHRHR